MIKGLGVHLQRRWVVAGRRFNRQRYVFRCIGCTHRWFPFMLSQQTTQFLWLCRLCRWEWEWSNAIQGIAAQGRDDLSGHLGGDSHLCLSGRCSQMRGGNDSFVREQLSQHRIVASRLLAEDVERHSCKAPLIERSEQRLLVDEVASCAVYQVGTRLEQVQFTGAKEPACATLVIGEGSMQGDEIGSLQHLFFAVQRHTNLLPLFGRDKGITG